MQRVNSSLATAGFNFDVGDTAMGFPGGGRNHANWDVSTEDSRTIDAF